MKRKRRQQVTGNGQQALEGTETGVAVMARKKTRAAGNRQRAKGTGLMEPRAGMPSGVPVVPGTPIGQEPAGGPSNPKSEIRNPQSPPPRAEMILVPIDHIDASRNPRKDLGEASLLHLQESIADIGQLEPIVVRQVSAKEFRLVAGGRRLEASRRAGAELVEAKVYGRASGVDDAWEAKARLAENVQRQDLNHMELASVFGEAVAAGVSIMEIADGAHISDDMVRRHLSMLRLAPPVADLVATGKLPVQHAEVISRLGDFEKQIELAGRCVGLAWKAKKAQWGEPEYRGQGWKTGDPEDHLRPMGDLRKDVSYCLRGLAACGWLKGEDQTCEAFHPVEGRGRCVGCPDNSATYADQPALFAGIYPQGSDKRGFCTNQPCYEHKSDAWAKVVEKRKTEEEKTQKESIKKARKAGLDVCGVCGRMAKADEEFKEYVGEKTCKACIEKEKKRQARGGSSEDYEAKRRAAQALAKKFPWTDEQRLAVAQYSRAKGILEKIGEAVKDGKVEEIKVLRFVCVFSCLRWNAVLGLRCHLRQNNLPDTLEEELIADLPEVAPLTTATLGQFFNALEFTDACEPRVDEYDGDIENVPATDHLLAATAFLERLAAAWGVEVPAAAAIESPAPDSAQADPAKPGDKAETPADVRRNAARNAILQGNKRQATAAINACTDVAELQAIQALDVKGDWRRAAIGKRIADLLRAERDAREEVAETDEE